MRKKKLSVLVVEQWRTAMEWNAWETQRKLRTVEHTAKPKIRVSSAMLAFHTTQQAIRAICVKETHSAMKDLNAKRGQRIAVNRTTTEMSAKYVMVDTEMIQKEDALNVLGIRGAMERILVNKAQRIVS